MPPRKAAKRGTFKAAQNKQVDDGSRVRTRSQQRSGMELDVTITGNSDEEGSRVDEAETETSSVSSQQASPSAAVALHGGARGHEGDGDAGPVAMVTGDGAIGDEGKATAHADTNSEEGRGAGSWLSPAFKNFMGSGTSIIQRTIERFVRPRSRANNDEAASDPRGKNCSKMVQVSGDSRTYTCLALSLMSRTC